MGYSTIASDLFNRANASTLGANWSTGPGSHAAGILSNQATNNTGAADCVEYWSANSFNNDQFSNATLVAINAGTNDFSGIIVRASATDFVVFQINKSTTSFQIIWYNGGAFTQIGSSYTYSGDPTGSILLLTVIGKTYTGYINGVAVITGTNNSTPATGSCGISMSGNNANQSLFDNWIGGNIITGGLALSGVGS
jgi:hypothetical protein